MYQFPKNKVAAANTLDQQINTLGLAVKNLGQVYEADVLDVHSILESTWLVVEAAEGILRKYPKTQVETTKQYVKEACNELNT